VPLPDGRGSRSTPCAAVTLLAATPNADRLAAMAARQCYSAGSILDLPQPFSPKQTAHLVNRVVSAVDSSTQDFAEIIVPPPGGAGREDIPSIVTYWGSRVYWLWDDREEAVEYDLHHHGAVHQRQGPFVR